MKHHKKFASQTSKRFFKKDKKTPPPTHTPEEMLGDMKISPKGQPQVTMMGSCWIHIENFNALADYTENLVRVVCGACTVCIEGRRLCVVYFTEDDVLIQGYICSIKYM